MLGKAPGPEDRARALEEFTATLAKALPERLGPLIAAESLTASCEAPDKSVASAHANALNAGFVHFHVASQRPADLLVSVDFATGLMLTDRLFGGDGQPPDPAPQDLPPSALLALELVARACGECLGDALENSADWAVTNQHTKLARIMPFAKGEYCLIWDFAFAQPEQQAWQIKLAARESDVQNWANDNGGCAGPPPHKLSPLDPPFHDIPLALRAEVAAFKLPFDRIANLKTGDLLPLALASEVPLKLGHTTLALGSIGMLDGRVALRLTGGG